MKVFEQIFDLLIVIEPKKIQTSSIGRHLMASDQTLFIFGKSPAFDLSKSAWTVTAIVEILSSTTTVVAQEVVLLIVASAEQTKHFRITHVAKGAKNHIVALLDRTKTNVFHGLDKGKWSAVSLACFLLEMHRNSMFFVDVESSPKLHSDSPCHDKFRETAPNERRVLKHTITLLLAEMTIFEHWWVSIEIT